MAMDEEQKKCGGLTLFGLCALGVSLAMIIIGALNIDFDDSSLEEQSVESTCYAEPKIPFYLLVGGILTILLLILRIVFQVM